jgi:hypothetical protein
MYGWPVKFIHLFFANNKERDLDRDNININVCIFLLAGMNCILVAKNATK